MDLRAGEPLDAYRLVAELGAGGQGTVWRAVGADGSAVALKLVDVERAGAADVERLRREAYALARLDHPSLVRCHRLFEDPRRAILGLVLDLVDGEALAAVERDPRLDRRRRLCVLRHLAGALAHLHAAGIAHRDVKAANVLVRRDFFDRPDDPATVVLVDLGIAAETGNPRPLTGPERVIGTKDVIAPEVLAPEALGGRGAGPERDVFAFGVLAMRLLVGRHPSGLGPGASLADLRGAYLALASSGVAVPVGVDDEPEALLHRRACALRPADRARDGAALVALLEPTIVETRPGTATAPRPVAASPPPTPPSPTWPDAPAPRIAPPPPPRATPARTGGTVAAVAAIAVVATIAIVVAWRTSTPAPSSPTSTARPAPPRTGPAPIAIAPARPATTDAPEVPPPACPPGAVPVRAGGSACVDGSPVTVREFLQRGGHLEGSADWPGATPDQRAKQTAGCRAARDGAMAVNCVDHAAAARHCAARGGRLPSAEEWVAAVAAGAAPGGVQRGALHEWTRDASRAGPGYRHTCAPNASGCDAANPADARNDDCGFRCTTPSR